MRDDGPQSLRTECAKPFSRRLDSGANAALVVAGATSMYVGAALATILFEYLEPAVVAWMRIVGAAAVLLIFRRPDRFFWRGRRALLAGTLGVFAALMNISFYEALARLPLGTAVAIEFVGPVLVAAWGSRSARDLTALASATIGVVLIADVHLTGSPAGLAFAMGAAICWACYIVLGKKAASTGSGLDNLAVGLSIAAVATAPLALLFEPASAPQAPTLYLLTLGIGLGVASNAIPYSLDQIVLSRVSQSHFALLLALLPLTAVVVGFLALGQVPKFAEAVGIGVVILAVLLRKSS